MAEAQMVLAMLLERFEFTLESERKVMPIARSRPRRIAGRCSGWSGRGGAEGGLGNSIPIGNTRPRAGNRRLVFRHKLVTQVDVRLLVLFLDELTGERKLDPKYLFPIVKVAGFQSLAGRLDHIVFSRVKKFRQFIAIGNEIQLVVERSY